MHVLLSCLLRHQNFAVSYEVLLSVSYSFTLLSQVDETVGPGDKALETSHII